MKKILFDKFLKRTGLGLVGLVAFSATAFAQTTPSLSITSANQLKVDEGLTVVVSTTAASGQGGAFTYSVTAGSGSATVDPNTGYLVGYAAGEVTLEVASAGDENYNPSSVTQIITVNKTIPTLMITSANEAQVDGLLAVTASSSASHAIGSLNYTLTNGTGAGFVDPAGNITAVSAGQVVLTVSSEGNQDYDPVSVDQEITIGPNTPILTFNSASEVVFGNNLTAAVNTSATYDRGGDITYSIVEGSGSATIDPSSGLITPIRAGTVDVVATSAGDADYHSASASQVLSINKANQVLSITSAASVVVDASLSVIASSNAPLGEGGALEYSVVAGSGSATIDPVTGNLLAISAGTVEVSVSTSGGINYNSATVSQQVSITPATPILTITSGNAINVEDSLNVLVSTNATLNRGGVFTYSLEAGSGSATIDPSTGLMTAMYAGEVTLVVSSAGDADYYPATASQVITINRLLPLLTFTSANTVAVDESLTALVQNSAQNSGGGALSYAIQAGSGSASIDPNTGVILGLSAGTVIIEVSSAGDANYLPTTGSQAFTVGMNTPILSINSANVVAVDGTLAVNVLTTATGGRGGALSYYVEGDTGLASVDSNTGALVGVTAGTVMVTASSAGDADYYPATVSQLITVTQAQPSLSINLPVSLSVDGQESIAFTSSATQDMGTITYGLVNGSGVATLDTATGLLTGVSVGAITISVTSSGNENYLPVTAEQEIQIEKVTPTLTLVCPASLSIGSAITATLLSSATNGRGGVATFSVVAGTGAATVDPQTGYLQADSYGTITLVVSTAGDENYHEASTSQVMEVTRMQPVLTITSANEIDVQSTLMPTVSTTALAGQGGLVTFAVVEGSGSATIDSVTGLLTAVQAGSITLVASAAGDTNYLSAIAEQFITINKISETLIITSANELSTDDTLTVAATSTVDGGGPILFSIAAGSGSATLDDSTGLLRAIKAGTVILTASTPGSVNYLATSMDQVITIAKRTPNLTITSAAIVAGTQTAAVVTDATQGRGGELTFSIEAGSGSATINPSTKLLTGLSVGSIVLTATSAGDQDYESASVSQEVTIAKAIQILTVNMPNIMYVDIAQPLTATSTATDGGGSMTFKVLNSTGSALIVGGKLIPFQHGVITLSVTSAGNANYVGATASKLITLYPSTPTLTITSANSTVAGNAITVTAKTTATYGRGGVITFNVAQGSGSATINPTTGRMTTISAGSVNITAQSAGDANYYPSFVTQLFNITAPSILGPVQVVAPVAQQTLVVESSSIIAESKAEEQVINKPVLEVRGVSPGNPLRIKNIENYPVNVIKIYDLVGGNLVYSANNYNNADVIFQGVANNGSELTGQYRCLVAYIKNGQEIALVDDFLKVNR